MGVRTMGVEEELLLFDAGTGAPAPRGAEVAAGTRRSRAAPGDIRHEFKLEQIETATRVCDSLAGLHAGLVAGRSAVAARAAEVGAVVAALATCPQRVEPTPTPGDRYALMQDAFGLIAREELVCGMHVHVGVDSPEEGVGVIDRIRCWLPVLLAMSANSPFWQGFDTGLASFQTVSWSVWPTAGPTERFGSLAGYRAVVERLVESGAALDAGMIYFDARLSARYPTVEIRVCDVCLRAEDAAMLGTVARALVDTAAQHWARGEAAPDVPRALLGAASWQAARHGLSGQLLDPVTFRPAPAPRVVARLLRHVASSLAATGELTRVRAWTHRLLTRGPGAVRQRTTYADGGLAAVVPDAVILTRSL